MPEELENQYIVKARLLFKSLSILKPLAVLVGKKDLVLGVEFLREMNKKGSLPLISSNLKSPEGKYLFKPYILAEFMNFKLGIYGLTGSIEFIRNVEKVKRRILIHRSGEKAKKNRVERENAIKASHYAIKKLKEKGANFVILLSDLEENKEKEILEENNEIDLVISSGSKFSTREPEKFKMKILVRPYSKLKYIGKMKFNIEGKKKNIVFENIPIVQGISSHQEIKHLVLQTEEVLRSLEQGIQRYFEKNTGYIGAARCQGCHEKQHEIWKRSNHSRAYLTLIKEKEAQNIDCIPCHNTGSIAEGFLENVQCEACHGKGKEHVEKNETMINKVDEKTCRKCHEPDRFPDFGFTEKLKLIKCSL